MASRQISDLSKQLQPLASAFINKANAELGKRFGASVILTCTYRSNDEQAKLYAIGRGIAGRKVTNAKPGQSKHNSVDSKGKPAAEAFDIAILVGGKLNWDLAHPVWEAAGRIGEDLGLEWAGRWERFREGPHFQLPKAATE